MADNENQIDKIYIDIEVKNTGINTLQTATNNLKDVVNNINLKGVDVSVTRNTLNTINTLSKLYKELSQIKKITSKKLTVNIDNVKTYRTVGNKKTKGDSVTTYYDTSMQQIKQQISETLSDGVFTQSTTDAFGNVIKEIEKYTDTAGTTYTNVINKNKDLNEGITKSTYVLDENNNKWLKNLTTIKETRDGLQKIEQTFNELGEEIKKTTTLTDNFGNVTKSVSGDVNKSSNLLKSLKSGLVTSVSKITLFGYGISKVSNMFKDFVKLSNDYVENLNLFQVTFGKMTDEAERFVDVYSKALGLDPSQVMRNMGFFNQIVTGFGISTEEGYKMSKLLTQLSYDLSSFVNIDIEDAMLKFQSGISGELEPLRRVGYALDEATLQQVAYEHGIQKSIRTMTQAEKAYIRLITMYEQSANVMGDLAATISSPANALRILEQQFTQFKRSIGNVLVPIVTKIIPILQGATKALTEFFNLLAEKMGYKIEGARENAYAEYMNSITTSAEEAQDAINGTLLSFDKFSVLNYSKSDEDSFTLPIPDYDALATLSTSLYDTSESFKKTYDLLANIFMNADRSDLSNSLKAILELIDAIWNGISSLWKNLIEPVVIPTLTVVIKLFSNLILVVSKVLDFFGGLEIVIGAIISFSLLNKLLSLIFGVKTLNSTLSLTKGLLSKIFVFLSNPKQIFSSLKSSIVAFGNKIKLVLLELVSSVAISFKTMGAWGKTLSLSFTALGVAIGVGIGYWLSQLEPQSRKTASAILLLVSAITAAAVAYLAFQGAMTMGIAVPIIVTAVSVGAAAISGLISSSMEGFATGGFTPETSGSLFMAGENGRPELMGTVRGKNAVANVNSIETAMENASYKGMIMALNQNNKNKSNDNRDIILQIDGKELARANVSNNADALSRNYRVEFKPR